MRRVWSAIAPFRSRSFRLYWFGQTASTVGNYASEIAWVWLLTDLTGSTAAIGIVFAAGTVPMLILMGVAGVWVDKDDPLKIGVWADVGSAVLGFVLALLVTLGEISVGVLLVFSVLYGILQAFTNPALGALFPSTVTVEDLTEANSLRQLAMQLASLVGPGLGGYIIAQWSIPVALAFDAATFVLSAACLFLIGQAHSVMTRDFDTRRQESPAQLGRRHFFQEMLGGIHYLLNERVMLAFVVLFALTNALNNVVVVLVPVLARSELNLSAGTYGLVASSSALGALSGSFLMGILGRQIYRRASIVCLSSALAGLAIVAMGAARGSLDLYAASALFGLSFIVPEILLSTIWQQIIPVELRGRVFGLLSTISMAMNPLGLVVAGGLGQSLGLRQGLWLGGGAIVVLSLGALLLPVFRRLDQHVALPPGPVSAGA